ncbi:EAL domain-containing protein [Rhodanobacter lindaniclasticus]
MEWWCKAGAVGLCCWLAVTPVATRAAPAPASAPPERMRVVGARHYPPYLFVDADGKVRGYDADMWRLFQAHTGIRVDLQTMDWDAAQQEVLSGQADVIDMIYRTPARDALYDFSAAYAAQPIGIYVDRRIRGVLDVASMKGLRVGVESSDACVQKLAAAGIMDLREYNSYQAVIQAAARGEVRIFCMDANPAAYYLYRYAEPDQFYQAFVLDTGHLHLAVRKGNTPMLQEVERGMALITPAEYVELRQRWLDQPAIVLPYLRMARIALAIILVLAALMTLWVWSLRRSVGTRTRELRAEKDKLRALFDASPDCMWLKDRERVYRACNDRVVELFQRRRVHIVGRRDDQVFDAAFVAEGRATDDLVMRSGRHHTCMSTVKTGDGTIRQFELIKVPMYAPDGTVNGVLCSARDVTERLQAEVQLRRWAHAFEHAAFGVVLCDASTWQILAANPVFARERGYMPEQMAGMPVDTMYPDDLLEQQRAERVLVEQREHTLFETEHVSRDGRRFPVLLDCSIFHDADGKAEYAIVYAQDITERKRAEEESRLAAATFQTQVALMVMDAGRTILRVNQAFVALTGRQSEEVVGQPSSLLRSPQHESAFYERLWQQVLRDGSWQGEQWIPVRQGQPRVVRTIISTVAGAAGQAGHYICSMVDLTSEREAHASVDRMTFFDSLTDLPNRRFLQGRLQHLLDTNVSAGGALLMIDLDHFKRVNDLRGHAAGDRLLALVARRLRALVDGEGVLSRLGGGSFALAVPSAVGDTLARSDVARDYAARVQQALREPFQLDAAAVTMTASIGWTELVPQHSVPETVLREAELAVYDAKAAGRDQTRRFDPEMLAELTQREALAHDLRAAIGTEALELHLQAQTDRQGRVVGAEALLRWTRASGEKIPPGLFIPIAEDNGLILPLGDWVLRRACELLVGWSTQPLTRELSLAANVSARQFAQPGFVDSVRQALAATGADPARLKLEITETAILDDLAEAAIKLNELRAHGIRISLDDFGTGYSSLSYLSRLPLDQLKIDQSFVAHLPDDANHAMVAQTIIGMGCGLGLEVIAEGVETVEQRTFLLAQGCNAFQGYLIARPLPLRDFEALLGTRLASA